MAKVLEQVPYLSQRNNWYNPDGSCNVTSIAMCLARYGIPTVIGGSQLEDILYQECYRRGLSRHSPLDLAFLAKAWSKEYGVPVYDDFTVYGSQEEICRTIDAGHPCVIHGYFTAFGHIIAVVGYDENGAIVHDPYGEYFRGGGYDRNDSSDGAKGKFLHYSWEMLRETCYDPNDGSWWLHRFRGEIEPNPYTDLGSKDPYRGLKLGDIIDRHKTDGEDELVVEFRAGVKIDFALATQVQICLNNHVKIRPAIAVDGVVGKETESAFNKMCDRFNLKKWTLAYDHARALIQGKL